MRRKPLETIFQVLDSLNNGPWLILAATVLPLVGYVTYLGLRLRAEEIRQMTEEVRYDRARLGRTCAMPGRSAHSRGGDRFEWTGSE